MATLKEWVREYWYLGLVAAVVGLFFWWQGRQPTEAPVAEPLVASVSSVSSGVSSAAATSSAPPKKGYVHIKGAVAKPGVYPVGPTTRWVDVVALAGGAGRAGRCEHGQPGTGRCRPGEPLHS